jgi:FlaA1/EpsC-like NDP-sugar epimerase
VLSGERVLVTGGTGSLGSRIVRRMLAAPDGPAKIVVFSRDEAKQHAMRLALRGVHTATDEVIYLDGDERVQYVIGDVRDPLALERAVGDVDVVVHAAALKQVPTCERFPQEAFKTNVQGASNLVDAIRRAGPDVHTLVGLSTDKAVKPTSVLGMTKAVQERIFVEANLSVPRVRFVNVRYGNVIASRGSVVPLFIDQIATGGPVTITDERMTRFLLTIDDGCDTVFAAMADAMPGETFVPRCGAVRIVDLVRVLLGSRQLDVKSIGVRPGEKVHELLVAEEELWRTIAVGDYLAVAPLLNEIARRDGAPALDCEFSSHVPTLDDASLAGLLDAAGLAWRLDPAS